MVDFYEIGNRNNEEYTFAVICASYNGKWVFVRHKDSDTWEIPGGLREDFEHINETALRKLYEETGAIEYVLEPICDYSVTQGRVKILGRFYSAIISEFEDLPDSEIERIGLFKELPKALTYPDIQVLLQQKVIEFLTEKALYILSKDKTRNINMINFIKSYSIHTIDIVGDSILIRGRSNEEWIYISSNSYDEFMQLIQGLDEEDKCFAVLEDWMVPTIIHNRSVQLQLSSIKLIYDGVMELPNNPRVTKLDVENASYIYHESDYKDYVSYNYIKDRIMNGYGIGIYVANKLIAWALTHDDGAIGFLQVIDSYRRKGYGKDVLIAMVREQIAMNQLPFIHIEDQNVTSMNIAIKAGFKKEGLVHWVYCH